MGAKFSGDTDEPIADINIVPFVDIILVVLIIFMVTTPIIMKPSINVNLPEAASGEETTPSKFSLTLTAGGELLLNGEPTTTEMVQAKAQEISAGNPLAQAIISADKSVTHGRVVSVIDAVKLGGIKKFAITIEKN